MIDGAMNFMLYFNLFISAYVLYYAIKGTGKIYENDYPQEMKESHAKLLRKFCWIVGIGMLPLTIAEIVMGGNVPILGWIDIGYVGVCIAVYLILFRMRYGSLLKNPRPRKK